MQRDAGDEQVPFQPQARAEMTGDELHVENGGGGFWVSRGTQFPCDFGRSTGWDRSYAMCRAQPNHRRALERAKATATTTSHGGRSTEKGGGVHRLIGPLREEGDDGGAHPEHVEVGSGLGGDSVQAEFRCDLVGWRLKTTMRSSMQALRARDLPRDDAVEGGASNGHSGVGWEAVWPQVFTRGRPWRRRAGGGR